MVSTLRNRERARTGTVRLDAEGVHYRLLNERIREAVRAGAREVVIDNVCGQRYIADALSGEITLSVHGTPGNDLAAFMSGPTVIVRGNAQDGVGNTMDAGLVVIHGNTGDIAGHSMRGGRIYVRGNAGYRVGIHMKAYHDFFPVVVIGGRAGDFLGEYMAGGLLVVLGFDPDKSGRPVVGELAGTGMHGGTILVRGGVDPRTVGKEVRLEPPSATDMELLGEYLKEYCRHFGISPAAVMEKPFTKLFPYTHRPYGKLYAY